MCPGASSARLIGSSLLRTVFTPKNFTVPSGGPKYCTAASRNRQRFSRSVGDLASASVMISSESNSLGRLAPWKVPRTDCSAPRLSKRTPCAVTNSPNFHTGDFSHTSGKSKAKLLLFNNSVLTTSRVLVGILVSAPNKITKSINSGGFSNPSSWRTSASCSSANTETYTGAIFTLSVLLPSPRGATNQFFQPFLSFNASGSQLLK